ncbi:protein FAR1-RELATED SEQUENCE 6-like [Papaver somniferum]|uniref:protein FAR1-RELATED SEQUENCE 6-like n=1 Tax=Papaver somniferum TaxID=3469 RepID=UPI000E7021D1|nr:protein FAR1-RELATED SEQUENCE 6-like [Papaver somniferum]
MRKSFMKNILLDGLRASKKKNTASDVIDLLRMEYRVDLTLKGFSLLFEASITRFNNYCLPMLFIDCTFVTWKFKGGFMVACGKTGNQEISPIAFGIVLCKNCESWQWFLTNLKGIIREDRPLTIISDRGIGLLKHVPEIFPNAHHSYCLYHMKGNIPVPKGKSIQTAVKLFGQCYTALTKENLYVAAKSMSNLKLDLVIAWMMKIPFDNLAAHAFIGERFGENTSNIAESFNNVIKHDKRLPALELVDSLRAKVIEQNYKRLLESKKWAARLTPCMQARFNKRITDFRSYKFRISSEKVFEIIYPIGKHPVDLDSRICSCKWWQKHSFPCTHAMKAMLQIGNDEPYKYIIPYYTSDYYRMLYSRPIYHIPDSENPPGITEKGYVLPPNSGRGQTGRPNVVRYKGHREKVRKKRKCG